MSADAADDDTLLIARDLAGGEVSRIVQLGGGRNSRVFRVDTKAAVYALKMYPPAAADTRDRLAVETAALLWMDAHGFTMVPRVAATDRARNAVLLTWADGELVRDGVGQAEIEQACDFLRRLHGLRNTPAVPRDHLATEACLSPAEIERQLRDRIASLRALDDPALGLFLEDKVAPELESRLERARATAIPFVEDLPQARRSQVPSDFGFHNALRRRDGRLSFIDFEYFGWDDPVKLVADILLHPGTPIDDTARELLRDGALKIYGDDPHFADRLNALLPLFGLRWALILLNEFRPDRWQRRVMAGASETWASAKQRQLAAASLMLDRHAVSRRTG